VNGRRILSLAICIVLGLFASAAVYVLAGNAADASGLIRHAAMTGFDVGDCTSTAPPCRTVQYAVDVADDDDVIKVAAGVYTGVNSYGGLAQVVYLSKTLTVRGGYTTTNWTTADPVANPTTLDAEGQGRVLYITGLIAPTIEGLRMTGGDAAGRGGGDGGTDGGGGVFVTEAAPTIRNCMVYSNTASSTSEGRGGGLYLHDSAAVLSENTIAGNTASTADSGRGGGLYLDGSDDATLSDNLVEDNIGSTAWVGNGGGLYLLRSDATLDDNTILDNVGSTAYSGSAGGVHVYLSAATLTGNRVLNNTASTVEWAYGGGLVLSVSPATLTGNIVRGNIASLTNQGHGGGLDIVVSAATLNDNTIAGNIASTGLSYGGSGGGLSIRQDSVVTMNRNTVEGNQAGTLQRGLGGGLFVESSELTLTGNQLITNTATLSPSATGAGGGLYAGVGTSFTLTNNVLAGNQANTQGDGLLFYGTSADPSSGRLLHTTIADNFGSGRGVSVPSFATLAFTNTIIAGHPGDGIWAGAGTTVTLQATLWYDNGTDTNGPGNFVPGTVNVYGDPAFVDPTTWDYHLTSDSAAIDEGVGTGVTVDMDGQSRPYGLGYDIGADEYVQWWQIYLPLVLRDG
jgi:parallel beta-helix repeat protein